MESVNNRSFTPLNAQRVYIGTYDNVVPYSSAIINLFSDTACEIIVYQSSNKQHTQTQTINTDAGVQLNQDIALYQPYIYFTVRNTSTSNQTVLNFTILYKNTSGGSASDVSITSPIDGDGNVKTSVENLKQDSDGTVWTRISQISAPYVDASNNINTSLNHINSNLLDANIGGLKVAVENPNLNVSVEGNTYENGNLDVNMNASIFNDGNGNLKVYQANVPTTYKIVDQNNNAMKVVPVGTYQTYSNNSLQVVDTNLSYTTTLVGQKNAVNVSCSDSVGNQILSDISGNLNVRVQNASINVNSVIPSTQVVSRQFVQNNTIGYNTTAISGNRTLQNVIIATDGNNHVNYIKFYDKASSPDVATDVPFLVINTASANNCFNVNMNVVNGIAWVCVNGIADNNSVNITNNVSFTFSYV